MNVGPGRWRLTWSCSGGVILLQLSFIQLEDHILLNRPIPRGSVAYTDVTLKDATKCTQRVHTSRHIGAHTQVRSHTSVLGKVARGSLPVRMSWPGITGNTPASNPSSARTATAASLARTTLPCTESVTCWSECVIAHNVIQTRCKLFTVFLTKIQLGRIVQQMNTFQYQKHKQNLFVKCRSRGSQQGCLYISAFPTSLSHLSIEIARISFDHQPFTFLPERFPLRCRLLFFASYFTETTPHLKLIFFFVKTISKVCLIVRTGLYIGL